MQYATLGHSGIKISKLCLGGMSFGKPSPDFHQWTIGPDDTRAVIKRAHTVLHQLEAAAVIYQCVSGNAGLGMVGLRETAVDYHQFASCFYRIFAAGCMYRYMSVDNMAVAASDVKGIQDAVAYVFIVAKFEIIAFFLLVCVLVG